MPVTCVYVHTVITQSLPRLQTIHLVTSQTQTVVWTMNKQTTIPQHSPATIDSHDPFSSIHPPISSHPMFPIPIQHIPHKNQNQQSVHRRWCHPSRCHFFLFFWIVRQFSCLKNWSDFLEIILGYTFNIGLQIIQLIHLQDPALNENHSLELFALCWRTGAMTGASL